jgi:hypothetical protein
MTGMPCVIVSKGMKLEARESGQDKREIRLYVLR